MVERALRFFDHCGVTGCCVFRPRNELRELALCLFWLFDGELLQVEALVLLAGLGLVKAVVVEFGEVLFDAQELLQLV